MAQTTIHRNWLAFRKETTVAQPPADWAAVDDGIYVIEHLSADPSTVKQTLIDDLTLERRLFDVGGRTRIKGLRNTTLSVGVKLHGTGVTTAVGEEVESTYLSEILVHCMGGMHQSTSVLLTGGTATVPTLADTTGIIPGCLIAFQDVTSPTAADTGKLHVRRVLSLIEDTSITLSEALPFTPANTDIAHGTITLYPDEDVLEDAVAGEGGLETFSWFIKKAKTGTELLWQLVGSVASFSVEGLDRGQLPSIKLDIMAANFKHGGEDGLTNPAFGTPVGNAQLSMGLDVQLNIGSYGATTLVPRDVNKVAFDVGFKRIAVETTTEKTHDFEGLASYSATPGNPNFKITLLPYQDDVYGELADGTAKRVTFYQPGDGSGAGKCWAIHMPKAQWAETPQRADVNEVHGLSVELRSMPATDCSGGSNEDLERARFLIALA